MNKLKSNLWLRLSFLLMLLVTIFPPTVDSAQIGNEIVFDDVGNLNVVITSTAATTGIRYRTVGWIVATKPMCKSYSGSHDCRPKQSDYVQFNKPSEKDITIDKEDPYVTTTWFFSKETVETQFYASFYEKMEPNQKLYFSAVMESYDASTGARRKKTFSTLNEIIIAEGWKSPEDLNEYFDLATVYNPKQPITEVLVFDDNGVKRELERSQVGEVKLYESSTHSLPETINLSDGRTANISRSYIVPAKTRL
ncbi:hypothetical protein [Paenibacillus taiwanensis]|uniref:hypothetical protein n=1 Tax=Paenibacillus taiwanensis TaxID=401638 RepID=UPI0004254AEB|nr:hypothetical protein [Paenibacillus taiwanensis]